MLTHQQMYISAFVLLVLVTIGIVVAVKHKKDGFKLEMPTFPNDGQLSAGSTNATYKQAYLDPPNLLQLPPYKKLYPANEQPLNIYTGLPQSMYIGSEKLNAEYTPDLLWCKQHI
jgi:hypothetical protein